MSPVVNLKWLGSWVLTLQFKMEGNTQPPGCGGKEAYFTFPACPKHPKALGTRGQLSVQMPASWYDKRANPILVIANLALAINLRTVRRSLNSLLYTATWDVQVIIQHIQGLQPFTVRPPFLCASSITSVQIGELVWTRVNSIIYSWFG